MNDPVADPRIELFRGLAKLAENDDWNVIDSPAHAAAGAFAFAAGSKDAALVQTLAPGAYTVHLGANSSNATGIGLIEIFELTPADIRTRLLNLSTRAFVGAGEDILIPGIVIGPAGNPNASRAVLIRAVGPGLGDFGITNFLERPQLSIISASGNVIAENIGWQSAAHPDDLMVASSRAGAFPLHANRADSALLVSLEAVPYTIQVSGADGGSGVALVEVYEVP